MLYSGVIVNLLFWALLIGSYLLGAVPFGLLIGRARGIDVRQHGSGNIGATNVGRVLGRRWGHLCLALDLLKGLVPTVAAGRLLVGREPTALELSSWLLVGLAAVLGHTFPIYLRFRGGKGVSTTIGVSLGIYPYFALPMLASLLVYGALRLTTGIVSLGSLAIAVVFPLGVIFYARFAGLPLDRSWPLVAVAVSLGVLIIVRHRSNIERLLRGQEMPLKPEV